MTSTRWGRPERGEGDCVLRTMREESVAQWEEDAAEEEAQKLTEAEAEEKKKEEAAAKKAEELKAARKAAVQPVPSFSAMAKPRCPNTRRVSTCPVAAAQCAAG